MAESILRDQDQYSCSICLDLLTDPVTIPCGHSYCMTCITDYWDKNELRKHDCPQCRQTFVPRPALKKNTILSEIMEKLRNKDLNATPAELGDIVCDFCIGKKVRAVHSCLECRASYCEMHLQPHLDFPALKRHKLVKATNMPSCQKHDKLLEVFCRTDQNCICVLCLMDDHKGHDTVSSAAERDEKQKRLLADRLKFKEIRQEKELELLDLEKAQKTHIDAAQQAVESTKKAFTATIDLMQKKCSEIIEKMQAQEKTYLDHIADIHEELQVEIAILKGHEDVLDGFLQTEDNIYFLQNFENMPTSSEAAEFPSRSVEATVNFEDIRKHLSEFQDSLNIFCKKEVEKILNRVSSFAAATSLCHISPGDRVRVKSSVNTPKYNWGSHVTHKSIGVVKALFGETVVVSFPGHEHWKGVLSEMELVTRPDESVGAADQNTIKVGDYVRVKANVDIPKYKWGGVSHNSLGVVKAFDGEELTVDFPECPGWHGIVQEMEVVISDGSGDFMSGSSSANCSFHTGDKVRVIPSVVTPTYEWGSVTHKSVGIVKAVKGDTMIVDFLEFQGWKGKVSEMELIPSEESGDFSSIIDIGDRVHVKATVQNPKNGWGEVSHESVGVVTDLLGEVVVINFPEQKRWLGIISEVELVADHSLN